MYTGISAAFLDVLRGPHRSWGYLEAWSGNTRLTVDDGLGNQVTQLPMKEDAPNEVPVDGTTPGPRRSVTATLAPTPGLWEVLEPVGTELRAYVVVRHPSGVTETVPQGVFPIDVQKMGYGPGGTMSLTAPDRWSIIQNARFLSPRASTPGITVRQQIINLLLEVLPAGTAVTDVSTSTATMPNQTEDRDRAGWIQKMATAASVDVCFDRDGNPLLRDVPTLNGAAPAWKVDAGDGGVLVGADRERNRQKTYNVVVVNGQTTDGTVPFPTVVVWDADPSSPTFAGPGAGVGGLADLPAASTAGRFGQRPYYYSSPLLNNTDQAQDAGLTILARVSGLAAQLTGSSIPNSALDDGDTVLVALPRLRRTDPIPREVHILDRFTVPLVPSRNPMPLSTRSTRPDDVQES